MRRSLMLKTTMLAAGLAAMVGLTGCATDGNQEFTRALGDVFGPQTGSSLTKAEVSAGLKEALVVGAGTVATQLSAHDGYFGDSAIRIPLPGILGETQEKLGRFGAAGPLDDLQAKINRAAEQAAPKGRELVVEAVRNMSINDAMGILRGGDTAATDYLKSRTSAQLQAAFKPYMTTALDQVGALTQAENVAGKYLPASMVGSVREDLTQKAVDGALDGMFYYLAKEEEAIRNDPVKRTTELLKKVFGG